MHPRIASRRGLVGMVGNAVEAVTDLVSTEFALARAEIGEKLAALRGSLAFLLGGAILLVAALFFALQAIVHALEAAGMAPQWATLLVAAGSAIAGGIMLKVGVDRFDAVPHRTLRDLERDKALAEEHMP